MSAAADAFFQRLWYERAARWLSWLLLPLSWLFGAVVRARRAAYRAGILESARVPRPVLVIGNITVGGTGKTPLTIMLAEQLKARQLRVGIVLRGYGGRSAHWPRDVQDATPWHEVGDEAKLLARRTGAIVVVGPDRLGAARRAVERGAEIVLADDGLQHYRLARDCEIAVIDGERGLGNGRLLPAGPLREPAARLAEVDLTVITRRATGAMPVFDAGAGAVTVMPCVREAISLATGETRTLQSFAGAPVHAIAGIGNPQAFFDMLSAAGLTVQPHPLPDHARLRAADISFTDDAMVLMTEKDAVKCAALADERHWAVRMELAIGEADAARLAGLLQRLLGTRSAR